VAKLGLVNNFSGLIIPRATQRVWNLSFSGQFFLGIPAP